MVDWLVVAMNDDVQCVGCRLFDSEVSYLDLLLLVLPTLGLADTKWSVVDVDLLTSNKRVWRVIMTSLNMRTLYSTVIRAVISYEDSDDVFLAYLRNDTQTRKYTDYSTS